MPSRATTKDILPTRATVLQPLLSNTHTKVMVLLLNLRATHLQRLPKVMHLLCRTSKAATSSLLLKDTLAIHR